MRINKLTGTFKNKITMDKILTIQNYSKDLDMMVFWGWDNRQQDPQQQVEILVRDCGDHSLEQ